MDFKRPRGTRDFLFDEMRERKYVESILRETFEAYAFKEVKTPLFEDLNLFTTKSGEEIVDQLYNFKDKSDRDITLRPEITAPISRLYLNELSMASKPIKLYYYGSCFRYERPQEGRFRQFWQFGCELIGAKSPQGEAEVLSLCSLALENLNIDAEIHLNHLGIIRGIFKHFNISEDVQREIITIIDKGDIKLLEDALGGDNPIIENKELNSLLFKLLDLKGDKSVLDTIKDLTSEYGETDKVIEEFEELVNLLGAYNLSNYVIDLSVARGLDYYTGVVFEVYVPKLKAQKQICGGGTYSLVKLFGGEEVESTGFAFGFDRLMNAIDISIDSSYIDVYIININEKTYNASVSISQSLREEGIKTDIDLSKRKFKKALKYANKLKVPYVVIVGERELGEGKVTVKNMETGIQEDVSLEDIADYIKK